VVDIAVVTSFSPASQDPPLYQNQTHTMSLLVQDTEERTAKSAKDVTPLIQDAPLYPLVKLLPRASSLGDLLPEPGPGHARSQAVTVSFPLHSLQKISTLLSLPL